MADANIFQIEDGVFALALVDRSESGYSDAWQAPGGATLADVTEADYDTGSATWKCQVTSASLEAEQDTTTVDVPATFCSAARSVPQPAQTSYSLDAEWLQDVNVARGLNRFLFEHDTKEAYFLLGLDGDEPPKAIGRVRVVAGSFGGPARDNLTATVSLPLSRKPDIEFGDAQDSEIVTGGGGAGPTPATGATAGTPGTWTPAGSTPPANAAGATSSGVTAAPTTAWTTGQYVQGSTAGAGGEMHWSGTAWATGRAT